MDGVILDSEGISDITWDKAAKDFNIKMTTEILNSCRGSNKNDILSNLSKIYGLDFDAESFLAKTGVYFSEIEKTKGIPLMPYAKETLQKLKPHYKIALASSTKGESVRRELSSNAVLDFFEPIISGELVTHSKPNPEIYLLACKKLGFSTKDCIAVEDSFNGIRSAHSAGLFTVMIPDKIAPTPEISALCDKIFPSLKDFSDFLLN